MRSHRFAQRLEIVAAFHARNNSATTCLVSPLLYDASHLHKIFVGYEQLAERIASMSVKPGRDDDEIRSELRSNIFDGRFKGATLIVGRRQRAQRHIQSVAATFSLAGLASRTCAWVPRVLMHRKIEY